MKQLYFCFHASAVVALVLAGLLATASAARAQPTIKVVMPGANARSAATTSVVSIAFSQPLTAASAAALKVYSAQRGGLRTRGTTPAVVSDSTLRFSPTASPFMPGETVFTTVTAAATGNAGSLARGKVMQFTTAVTGGGRRYFASGTGVSVGYAPTTVAAGDVDGDGDLDLVTADNWSATITIALNGGDATGSNTAVFRSGSQLYVGGTPYSLALSDVDGDGDLDVLVSNTQDRAVNVRLNGGDATGSNTGAFSNGSDVSLGPNASPYGLAVADVDGDGDLDILTANADAGTVSVRLNGGNGLGTNTGSFSNGTEVAVGTGPAQLAVGDVDGDGDLDLLVANTGSNTVSVRLNGGNAMGTNSGTFSNGSTVVVGSSPTDVAVGDLDGDGDLDLLVCNNNSTTATVRLNGGDARGSNTGVFGNGSTVEVGSDPLRVALADADGDGDLDLFTTNWLRHSMSVRLNGGNAAGNGTGAFSNGNDLSAVNAYDLALGDLDGDGDLDIATANYDIYALSVYLNKPLLPAISSVVPAPNARAVSRSSSVTVTCNTPLTADFAPALQVYSAQRGGLRTRGATLAVVSGSSLAFAPTAYPFMAGETVSATVAPAAVVGSNISHGQVRQFTAAVSGPGRGYFRAGAAYATSEFLYKTALADVDGDGDLDLFALNRKAKSVSVRLNGGDATGSNTGVFSNGYTVAVGPAGGGDPYGRLYDLALGDVDGDGDIDLVTADGLDHTASVRFNRGGTGGFSSGYEIPLGNMVGTIYGVSLGDVDGDGDLDLFALNSTTYSVDVLLNGGNSTGSNTGRFVFHHVEANVTSTQPSKCLVADIDGDGDLDFLTLGVNEVGIRLNQANNTGVPAGNFSSGTLVNLPYNRVADMALGDVDGDGDLDMVTVDGTTSGGIQVWFNGGTNTGVFSSGASFASSPAYQIALADVDSDGDLDIIFPENSLTSNYAVGVYLNGNNAAGTSTGIFGGVHEYPLPNFTNYLALGDVDGDGDVDVVGASGFTNTSGVATGVANVRLNESTSLATTRPAAAAARFAVFPTVGTDGAPRYIFTGPTPTTGASLTVFSLTGQRVWEQKTNVAATGVLPVGGLASGWYVVRLQTAGGIFVGRFFHP